MQTTKQKRDPASYTGRPAGSRSKSTIRKMAVKLLESAVQDDNLSPDLKTKAALQLLAENNNG